MTVKNFKKLLETLPLEAELVIEVPNKPLCFFDICEILDYTGDEEIFVIDTKELSF